LETNIINKQHVLQVDVLDDIRAVVDAQALEQVLTNLISNAIKYSPMETTIQVRAHFQDPEVIIEVEDNGLGISLKHRARLFERFYRVDKGRSRDEGGTGLGLAIV
jgi:two-component system phosphate regulon sensor histidine kinase PhoR